MTKRIIKDAIEEFQRSCDTVKLSDAMKTRVENGDFFQKPPTAEFIILAQAAEIVNDPERLKEAMKDAAARRDSLQKRTDRVQKDIDAVKSLNRRVKVRK